ncbi:MAG: RICIN domain-containing protein [Mycobacteriaceae bacterium]|nr:RICIN domain-containing protein [Mycobacteriaceae bacterium]
MAIDTQVDTQVDTRVVRLQGGGLRFLEARPLSRRDLHVVTGPSSGFDGAQQWRFIDLGGGECLIQQVSTGRFLDAARHSRVVARPRRDGDDQRWRLDDLGGGFVTIAQVSSGRFLEATLGGDFEVVLRPGEDNEQIWRIGEP